MQHEVLQHVYIESFKLNPLNAKFTKWPNTLKQFVGKLPTNCLSVFGHFLGLALKGLRYKSDLNLTKIFNLKNLIQLLRSFDISTRIFLILRSSSKLLQSNDLKVRKIKPNLVFFLSKTTL